MKFLESFGIEFTKYYGTAVVTAAEKEVEVYEDLRKLKYRDVSKNNLLIVFYDP